MENVMGKDKMKVIKELRARLNWLVYEASDDEFNEEEVKALMDLIRIMDPAENDESYFTAEKSLERFWKSFEQRDKIYEEFEKLKAGKVSLADYPDDECPDESDEEAVRALIAEVNGECDELNKTESSFNDCSGSRDELKKTEKEKNFKGFSSRKGFTKLATAAALVVAVFLGGTMGAYAEKEGFFHWTKKDDKGSTVIVSSNLTNSATGIVKYDSFERLPEKYQEIIWKPSALPNYFDIEKIEIFTYRVLTDIESTYTNENTDEFIRISQKIFEGDLTTHDTLFDSYEYVAAEIYDVIEVQYLRSDNEGVTEYVATFCVDNQECTIKSNLSYDVLKEMIIDSIKDFTD